MGANTTVIQGNFISITPHATFNTDWKMSVDTPFGTAKVSHIIFEPDSANDTLVIKNKSDSGPLICKLSAASSNDQKIAPFFLGSWCNPVIDASYCSMSNPENCRILIFIE